MPPPTQRNSSPSSTPAARTSSSSSAPAAGVDPGKALSIALTNLNSAIHAYISQSPKKDAARRRCVKQVYHLLGRLLED